MKNYSNNLESYSQKLLDSWEEIYKKGQLTLWILLALKDSPKHMAEIKGFIIRYTNGTLSADDQSMYRALRRYYDAEMVSFISEAGNSGPDRKVYSLTKIGQEVLQAFVKRNITSIFYKQEAKELLK